MVDKLNGAIALLPDSKPLECSEGVLRGLSKSEDSEASGFSDFGQELEAEVQQAGLMAQFIPQQRAPNEPPSLIHSSQPKSLPWVTQQNSVSIVESKSEPQVHSDLLAQFIADRDLPQEGRDHQIHQGHEENELSEEAFLTQGMPVQVELTTGVDQPVRIHSALSGSEFLDTLSSVRSGLETINEIQKPTAASDSREEEKGGDQSSSQGNGFEKMTHLIPREAQAPQGLTLPQLQISATVVKTGVAESCLSAESLVKISSGIRELGQAGGGEMRVKLNPGRLGELNIHVKTDGNQVGLKIQASSEESKKILESNLVSLKERLSHHHLTLSQVDVSIASFADLGRNVDQQSQFLHQQGHSPMPSGQFFSGAGDLGSQGRGGGWERSGDEAGPYRSRGQEERVIQPGLGRSRTSSLQNGRIDVRA